MSKLLITGGTGFIGKAICENLKSHNYLINITSRNKHLTKHKGLMAHNIGEIDQKTNWIDALDGVNYVIHCAAKTHVLKDLKKNSLFAFRKVNVEGTINLAKQAAACGVKRLIFLSSIKVNGEKTVESSMFKHNDISNPEDAYGISKWEAERGLWEISKQTGLEVVIIRAPLVYGRGVKGNLKRLIKLIKSGTPLPFSLVKNKRSLIGIDNLVDIITRCIDHPNAAGKTFLVCDGEDLSTPDLLHFIASAMGRSARMFPLPISLLKLFGFVLRRQSDVDRLIGSLQIDNSFTKEILNWNPPVDVEEGIRRMVNFK